MQFCQLQSQKWSLLQAEHSVHHLFSFSRQHSSLFQSSTNKPRLKFRFMPAMSCPTVQISTQSAHQPGWLSLQTVALSLSHCDDPRARSQSGFSEEVVELCSSSRHLSSHQVPTSLVGDAAAVIPPAEQNPTAAREGEQFPGDLPSWRGATGTSTAQRCGAISPPPRLP